MELPLDQIIIRKRVRRNLGDLASLMDSLKRHGLMNPIVINERSELIAGHRRMEAAKRLGWKTIDVHVVGGRDKADLVEMEIEENTQRKNLTTDELAEAYLQLDRLRNPSLIRRIINWFVAFFRRLFGRR
jgi:ParB family chromosome partitioning protein